MSKKNLTKDKSFYSLRKLHTKSANGNIFENDYVTIVGGDNLFDEVTLYPQSIFKYKIGTNESGKRRHVKTEWVSGWTGEKYEKNSIPNEDSNIILKPNYKSLKDFAYYGSAVELIKATVNDIILRYPGGLYFYDEALAPKITYKGKDYYQISNECQIDCWSKDITSIEKGKNPLRYLSYSYNEYGISNPKINITGNCLNTIIGTVKIKSIDLYVYKNNDGQNILLSDEKTFNEHKGETLIEPKEEHFNKFWNSLDDFERVLLNRNTTPLYMAVFDTPFMNETGYYYTPKKYIWPTIGKTNSPDLTSLMFHSYLDSLIELAIFHDEYDSDNIWRVMTHESIKNLDWTFMSNDMDISDIDASRMKAMVHIQGRQFDDIKRYIDNIKYTNSITYDEQNNVPDYFLSDINENEGWETINVANNSELTKLSTTIEDGSGTTISLFTSGKTPGFVNSTFLRRLALSSSYIHSMKGTKKGVETILKMFGFNDNDFEIKEWYAKTESLISYDAAACERAKFDYTNADEIIHAMEGYPVMLYENGSTILLGPWYDANENYGDDFYYQCKGGWGKINKMSIDKSITKIKSINGDYIYRETSPYLLLVKNLDEMLALTSDKIENGTICYVTDITGISNIYKSNITINEEKFSHYFIIEDKKFSTFLGQDVNGCYGWKNIFTNEFDGTESLTENGKKVLYLETLIPNYKDNNPHTGKGQYDFGLSYLEKYHTLFKEALEDGRCDNLDEIDKESIRNIGFNINTYSADTKIYSYSSNEESESQKIINMKNISIIFKNVIDSDDKSLTNEQKKFYKEYKNYILEIVIPFIESMLPSTIIVEYLFNKEQSYLNNKKYTK